MIWISCEGENPADVENLGPINYLPALGFPGYFFPFQNQKGYMPPLLAIHFERPKCKIITIIINYYLCIFNHIIHYHFSWCSH